MKKKFFLVLLPISLFVNICNAGGQTTCYCNRDGVEYSWVSNAKCSAATGKATKIVNGKDMGYVNVKEAIDYCL
jgi:hypothetical protein